MANQQPKKRRRYPVPLLSAARELKVSYPHLWLVMNGRRKSLKLIDRYNKLVRDEAAKWEGGPR